jgi:hypothetical protein
MNERLRKIAEHIPGTEAYDQRKQHLAASALRSSGDPTIAAIQDVTKTMGGAEFSYEAHERARISKLPHGPGLDQTQINKNLYRDHYEDLHGVTGSRPADFYDSIDSRLREYLEVPADGHVSLGSSIRSTTSNQVNEFVKKHRRVPAFFTPEMVQEAIAGNPDIVTEYAQEDGVEEWQFSTVNESGETEAITLRRGGEHPEADMVPYLPVTYKAEYDAVAKDIVFMPQIPLNNRSGVNDGMPFHGGTIGQRIMGALDVQAQRVHQPLEFRIDEAPMSYLSLGGVSGTPDAYVGDHGATMRHIDTPPRILIDLA